MNMEHDILDNNGLISALLCVNGDRRIFCLLKIRGLNIIT